MAKIKTSVVFKKYSSQQILLLPPSLEELIAHKQVVEAMDLSELINLYEGGGASA